MEQKNIEIVDSNEELAIQCATINTEFESSDSEFSALPRLIETVLQENELRKHRGIIVDSNQKIVCGGSFFPYEFVETDIQELNHKMQQLDHQMEDVTVGYSYEGTIIRIFYYRKWYVSTHRKLDAGRSKWGSNNSFKFLFEEALKHSYNMTLKELFCQLNLRCQYNFILMADDNTRFVCEPTRDKRIYFVSSNDLHPAIKIDSLPKYTNIGTTEPCKLEELFEHVKHMSYPFQYQGLLLTHKSGSQYRIVNQEYATLFKVRNNEQSIPYRYLQLLQQSRDLRNGENKAGEMIELLKKLFPQYTSTFVCYEQKIVSLVEFIFQEYKKRKQRENSTTVTQIDQKVYLFIKTKLLKQKEITSDKILELLWTEEPSNINRMIKMIRYNDRLEEQKLVVHFTPSLLQSCASFQPLSTPKEVEDPERAIKKKKIKYTRVAIEYSCRKKLF